MALGTDAQRIYQLIIDAGGSKTGAEVFRQAAEQIAGASAKAAAAGKPLTNSVAATEREYARLVRSIDPVSRAQQKMAKEIATVAAAFNAQIISMDEAKRRLDQINGKYERTINSSNRLGGGGDSRFLSGVMGQLAGFISAGYVSRLTKDAIDAVGGLGELASQIGVTSDTLQAFDYAGSQVGVSSEEMRNSLARLTRTVGDAAEGGKSAIDTFNALGVNILDANGAVRSTEDILRDVANALQRIDDPARRASLAVDLFGKAGQKMLPFLEGGSAGIDELIGKARELGLVFDTETIAKADKASDSIAALQQSFSKLGQAAATELAPALTRISEYLTSGIPDVKLFFDTLMSPERLVTAIKLNSALGDLSESAAKVAAAEADFANGKIGRHHLDEAKAEYESLKKTIDDLGASFRALQPPKELPLDPAWQRALGAGAAGTSNPVSKSGSTKTDAGAEAIKALQQQIAYYGEATNAEKALYDVTMGRLKDETAAEKEKILSLAEDLDFKVRLTKVAKELADQQAKTDAAEIAGYDAIVDETSKAWDARVKSGQKLTEEVRTPLEKYLATISELNVALSVGTINQETYNRQVAKAQDSFDQASDGATYFRDVADDAMGILQAGLFDAAFAADNLNDALRGVLLSLAKMAANKAFGAIADKGLDALFKLFGGGPSVAASTGMSTTAANGWSAFINHSGGSAGRGPTRSADPAWFAGAPRFHGGGQIPGLRANEVPIIAEAGETIRTRGQEAAVQVRLAAGSRGGDVYVSAPISIQGSAGTPEQNTDLATKMQERLQRAVEQAVDARIADNQRTNGLLNSGMGF